MTPKQLAASLPKKLTIGPYPYRIEFADEWLMFEGSKKWGLCSFDTCIISITNPSLFPSTEMFVGVVIHEILHAMWSVGNIPDRTKEEPAVLALETQLVQLFKNNPTFIAWVTKGLK